MHSHRYKYIYFNKIMEIALTENRTLFRLEIALTRLGKQQSDTTCSHNHKDVSQLNVFFSAGLLSRYLYSTSSDKASHFRGATWNVAST